MNFWKLRGVLICVLTLFTLTSCLKLKHDHANSYKVPNRTIEGAVVGNVVGLGIGIASQGNAALAVATGTLLGAGIGFYAENADRILERLDNMGIQVIRYGENVELILNSDTFFETDSADLRRDRFSHLIEVAALLKNHTEGRISISAFKDDVGSEGYKLQLTFRQAQSFLSYFWAHGIDYKRIRAVGYGDAHDVAENTTLQGNAFNRRVEIHFKLPVKYEVG